MRGRRECSEIVDNWKGSGKKMRLASGRFGCAADRSILPHLLQLSQGFLIHNSPSRFSSFRIFRILRGSIRSIFLLYSAGMIPVCSIFCGVQHYTPAGCGGASVDLLRRISRFCWHSFLTCSLSRLSPVIAKTFGLSTGSLCRCLAFNSFSKK